MAPKDVSTIRWFQGLCLSSISSLVYLLSPTYIISSFICLVLHYPCKHAAFLYAAPLLISILIPTDTREANALAGWLADYMIRMLDYFDYDEILELSNDDVLKLSSSEKKFIIAMQPHGVISFVSLCSWINAPIEIRCVPTAVASALLKTPILKNVMGIYGLVDASQKSIKSILKHGKDMRGCIVLYIGGIAELFKTSQEEERLYLKKRKGFIKIALREGVDIVPVYLFGNTSVLNVLKTGFLANLSRKMQVSVTYFWGKWNLPIPRDDKLLYVRGKPMGLPHIADPSDEDVNKWHEKYCEEVTRLYMENRERLPAYKHKKLFID